MSESLKLKADETLLQNVKFDEKGLIPAISQDRKTGDILMLAYMNTESLQKTLESGHATFWSRSRQKLWMKGETSGNVLKVFDILVDCDHDTLLLHVDPAGPTCHTGERTCFYRFRQVFQSLDISFLTFPLRNASQNIYHLFSSNPAWHTLSARFLLGKVQKILGHINHTCILIHDDHSPRTHDRPGFSERVIVNGKIQLLDRNTTP